ncbi:hypothetical protein F5880DRAFT_1508610 [Lentinula raphanica]|nr:hypothetical protein F5880DRAFT_1508610 [Lentinula raphanica]
MFYLFCSNVRGSSFGLLFLAVVMLIVTMHASAVPVPAEDSTAYVPVPVASSMNFHPDESTLMAHLPKGYPRCSKHIPYVFSVDEAQRDLVQQELNSLYLDVLRKCLQKLAPALLSRDHYFNFLPVGPMNVQVYTDSLGRYHLPSEVSFKSFGKTLWVALVIETEHGVGSISAVVYYGFAQTEVEVKGQIKLDVAAAFAFVQLLEHPETYNPKT